MLTPEIISIYNKDKPSKCLLPIKKEILKELNGWEICLIKIDASKLNTKLMWQICNSAINWFWFDMDITDIQNHVNKSDEKLFIVYNWKIIWFTSFTNIKGRVPYLYWAVIDSRYHWLWIQTLVNGQILNHIWELFFRTQNRWLIKSFQKLWLDIYLWEDAYRILDNKFTEAEKKEYFWDNFEAGVYKWAYWQPLWKEWNVDFIDWDMYWWFEYKKWDSLLVYVKK